MTKAFGVEINEFYNTGFPEDAYTEEMPEWIEPFFDGDNKLALVPTEKYDLSEFGYVIDSSDSVRTFSTVFSRWQKQKGLISLVVSMPENKIDEFKKLLEHHTWVTLRN